jgi:UDP-3-O-[3-hydroxymyristoyl] glucosamine N-acyltransferase
MIKGILRQLLLVCACFAVGITSAQAGRYAFSYTFSASSDAPGARISGVVVGDPDQANPNRIIVSAIESAQLEIPGLLDPGGQPFSYAYPVDSSTAIQGRGGEQPVVSFDSHDLNFEVCFRFNGSLAQCSFSNNPALAEFGFWLEEDITFRPDPDTASRFNYDADGWARVNVEYWTGGTGPFPTAPDAPLLRERSDYLYYIDDESGNLAGPGNFYEQDAYEDYVDGLIPAPSPLATLVNGEFALIDPLFPGSWTLVDLGGSGGGLGNVDPSARIDSDQVDPSVDVGANSIIRSGVVIGAGSSVGANTVIRPDATIGSNVSIGDNVIVARNVQIGDNSSVDSNSIIRRDSVVRSNVQISSTVILGREAEVGSNTQVGTGVIIRRQAQILDSSAANPVVIGIGAILGRQSFTGTGVQIGDYARIRVGSTVGDDAVVGSNVFIRRESNVGANVVIGSNTRVGRDTVICPGVTLGVSSRIGRDQLIVENVGDNVRIPRAQTPSDPNDCEPF